MQRSGKHPDAGKNVRRDLAVIAGWFAALSVAYWAAVFLVCGKAGFPLDDAFIHLQFARHVYEDGQMAFNKGVPSSGSTAPLYPMLLAGVYHVVRDWYAASFLLGAICSLGTAWVVCGILRSWTGRADLARWGGILTVVSNPTIVQAYGGMESAAYSLLFLLGLWLYGVPGRRTIASAVLALCVWLRPEFIIVLPLVCIERAVAASGTFRQRVRTVPAEVWRPVAVWALVLVAYGAYHWHQDQHLVPSTFAAKAVAPNIVRPPWFDGLPAALRRGHVFHVFLSATVWPLFVLLCAGIGLCTNCVPLAFGLPAAARALWREKGTTASGRRLALLVLVGYPWVRGFVDPGGVFWFHQQRYYAHLTPLFILVVVAAIPATGACLQRRFWSWRGQSVGFQRRRTLLWAGASLFVGIASAALSVSNISDMQVALGHWVREHTPEGRLVATNDIGAIAFISRRPILDTVGLVEPEWVEHAIAGGTLLAYLQRRDPAYVILFPNWYEELTGRADLLEPVHSVTLDLNVICGGPKMVVYRPRWNDGRVNHVAPASSR